MSDQEILAGLKSHNRMAVERVYSMIRPGVESFVCQNSGTREEAKDVVQEAMVAAYLQASSDDFKLECALSTYIQGIARRVWLKHLERYKRRYRPDNRV